MVAVRRRLETDDAAPQQPVQDLRSPRADPEPLRMRPRNVPEGDHRGPGYALPDEAWREGEVVVLDEDDRVSRVDLGARRVREHSVGVLVVAPVRGPEDGPVVREVAERPEAFVGEALVIPALLGGAEPHASQPVGLFARWHGQRSPGVHRLAVGRTAPMRDPGSAAGAQDGLQGGHDAPGRTHDPYAAVARALVDVGRAVGDHDDPLARELLRERALQASSCPDGAARSSHDHVPRVPQSSPAGYPPWGGGGREKGGNQTTTRLRTA